MADRSYFASGRLLLAKNDLVTHQPSSLYIPIYPILHINKNESGCHCIHFWIMRIVADFKLESRLKIASSYLQIVSQHD